MDDVEGIIFEAESPNPDIMEDITAKVGALRVFETMPQEKLTRKEYSCFVC
jgi:hypothetical protein